MPTTTNEHIPPMAASSGPPQATELEQSVLGSALIEKQALYTMLEKLAVDDFYSPRNGLIFDAFKALFESDRDPDIMQIEDYLRDRGQLDSAGGSEYIAGLTQRVRSAVHTENHCDIIIGKRKRRNAIRGFHQLLSIAQDNSTDLNDMLSRADQIVFDLANDMSGGGTVAAADYISEAYLEIVNVQGAEDGVTGIGTGTDLDQLTAGWQNSEFIVIAARPSMGKTAFVLESMKYAARKYGAAGVLSLEMSSTGLGKRMLISEAGIDGQRARRGTLHQEELKRLDEAANTLQDIGLVIDDTTFVDAARLRAKARSMIHKYEIKVLAIDYMQLLTSDKENREQQVADVSRTCKAIAKEYNIPVIGLSQLNRSCESRRGWDKRPQLADLRESGAIEQDADVVGFLFRPMYYNLKEYPESVGRWAGTSTESICEIIIGKNRNGPTGKKRLGFDPQQARFYNLAPEPDNRMAQAFTRAEEQQNKYNYKSPF